MSEIERITKVIEWSGLSENAFAKRIGYSSGGSIYNKLNGNRGINIKFITKIANAFPEINKAWLLTGIGEMKEGVKTGEIVEESKSNNFNNLIMTFRIQILIFETICKWGIKNIFVVLSEMSFLCLSLSCCVGATKDLLQSPEFCASYRNSWGF